MNRSPRPCNVPTSEHDDSPARRYPCGWRCDRHSPWALKGWTSPTPFTDSRREDPSPHDQPDQ